MSPQKSCHQWRYSLQRSALHVSVFEANARSTDGTGTIQLY